VNKTPVKVNGKVKRYTKSYEKDPQAQGNTPNP